MGASSMNIPVKSKEWRVFTDVSYLGDTKVLQAGRKYQTLASMGLESPVKSMRPAEPQWTLLGRNGLLVDIFGVKQPNYGKKIKWIK